MLLTNFTRKAFIVIEKLISLLAVFIESQQEFSVNQKKLSKLMFNLNAKITSDLPDARIIKIFGRDVVISDFDLAWHADPFSLCEFPRSYIYFRRPKTQAKDDIKSIWELSRLNFILPVILEVQKTGKANDIEFVKTVILSFVRNNRFPLGIHWINPMEVSIRSVNICLALSVINDFLSETERAEVEKYIIQSAFFVFRFRENKGTTNNHYMSNILFITVAAELFDICAFKEFAQYEFERELNKQVYRDGTVFEASTYYHRLTLEIVFFTILFKVKMNTESEGGVNYCDAKKFYSRATLNSLYKMFLFVRYSIKDNGELPIVGDNDSGQILKVYNEEVLDVRYLLSLGSFFFRKDLFIFGEVFAHPLAGLISESSVKITCNKYNVRRFSRRFRDSGWLVVRDDDIFLFITAGKIGQAGKGGHGHNDKTSYLLTLGHEDIVLAGGTYSYTCSDEIRRANRSNVNHNVVSILVYDKVLEQSDLSKGNFVLEENCHSQLESVLQTDRDIVVECSHACYESYTGKRHGRRFLLDRENRRLTITDSGYQGFPIINNVVMNSVSVDRLSVDTEYREESYHYSEIYFCHQECKRIQFEDTKYEIQL